MIDSADRVQKEYKRMKVLNNREKLFDKTVDTHFVRQSRCIKWKNHMEKFKERFLVK